MCALARRLIRKGHAYPVPGGGIDHDVSTFPRYGQLSRLRPARMRALPSAQDDARLEHPGKRHPLDFALWRQAPTCPTSSEPVFGRGRPGGTSSAQRWPNATSACRWTFMVEEPTHPQPSAS